jgi:hypothetical protein
MAIHPSEMQSYREQLKFTAEQRAREQQRANDWAASQQRQRNERAWAEHAARLCHVNLNWPREVDHDPLRVHAAVAARHVRNASSRRTRSVRRDVRWRWTLNVLWTAA